MSMICPSCKSAEDSALHQQCVVVCAMTNFYPSQFCVSETKERKKGNQPNASHEC